MVAITGSLIVQILVFLAMIWVVKRLLWGPLTDILEERKKRISDGLAAAERGKRELNEAIADAEARMGEARDQAQEILASAERQANDNIERSRSEARAEGERIVHAAREEIDQAVASAKAQLRHEVGALAVTGAERILKREIDSAAHNDIIDDLVAEIR